MFYVFQLEELKDGYWKTVYDLDRNPIRITTNKRSDDTWLNLACKPNWRWRYI